MLNKCKIAASILAADAARLGEEATAAIAAGVDMIHFDVMDNHYVPNLTLGPMVCKALKNFGIKAPIDVHLMAKPVDELIIAFAKAGADYITFHPEASLHVDRSLRLIHDLGCKAGLALNPATPPAVLEYTASKLDLVLVMAVNPGFSGQTFIPSIFSKITAIKDLLITAYTEKQIRLEVDGGIKLDNIAKIRRAGADTFVVGSEIFQNSNCDYAEIVGKLKANLIS